MFIRFYTITTFNHLLKFSPVLFGFFLRGGTAAQYF